ncbi:SPX domain-containing protein [Hypoxylon sp. NC1633]|nr:SPX domain-containing protein [Hypoxylon sp. NC1633]
MKFSHSIQFNAVPDWSSHYIAYSNLKKLIYGLEKTVHQPGVSDVETRPLLRNEDPETVFGLALDVELEKISSFYGVKEKELFDEVDDLLRDIGSFNVDGHDEPDFSQRPILQQSVSEQASDALGPQSARSARSMRSTDDVIDESEDDDYEEDETSALNRRRRSSLGLGGGLGRRRTVPGTMLASTTDMTASTDLTRSRRYSAGYDDYAETAELFSSGIMLKKRIISLYVQLCELKSYVQLNKTGFYKVLKKFDKIIDREFRSRYMEDTVEAAYPFLPETVSQIEEYVGRMEKAYADIAAHGDEALAKKDLRSHLREHVVWERNTVWRELIGLERRAEAATLGKGLLGAPGDAIKVRLQGDDAPVAPMKEIETPVGRFSCPAWLFGSNMFTLLGILATFLVLLFVPIMDKPEQQNCLAMLVLVSLLWATEAIPLFVTSLLIPFLCVVLRVVCSDGPEHKRLKSAQASPYIFSAMWTSVIMLLLGGFTVAAALSKCKIDKRIATFVLSKAGTKPRTVLVTTMFVAAFASMLVSNVAAPVLCFSIIEPMLRNLPAGSSMSKAVIMGIALASNIGGMLSPIASPQNLVALSFMEPAPTWGAWLFVVIPVGIVSILLIWILLLTTFRPGKGTTIVPIRPVKEPFTGLQWFVSAVCLATIGLWCASHPLESTFGDMGIIAIIPMVLFFGTGILTKEDFNNFPWTIIILAAGGLSLGKAVKSSGLLHTVAESISQEVDGVDLYGVLLIFSTLTLVIATFISHTVAALIILPLVSDVGKAMDDPHPNLLVMGAALMCSAAMALPTSGFPNMSNGSCQSAMLSAFTARPIIELKSTVKSKIESILAYGDRVLVGLNTGCLRVYRLNELSQPSNSSTTNGTSTVQPDSKPTALLREVEKFSPRAIEQLAIIKEANILVSLSNYYISLHDLQTYELIDTISRTKNATCFALTSNIVKDDATGIPEIISRLAVAAKRRLLLWSWHESELHDDVTEIVLPETIRTLTWANATKVICGVNAGYVLVDVTNSETHEVAGLGAAATASQGSRFGAASMGYMGLGGYMPKPLATSLAEGQMLLAKDINSLFIDTDGKPLEKRQVPWQSAPESIGYSYPYILALQPPTKGTLEVRNPETLSLLQTIELPGAAQLHFPPPTSSLAHAGKGFHISSERAVWKMEATDYDTQVQELVDKAKYDEAISVLGMLEDALLTDKIGTLREAKMLKAEVLFKKKLFSESLALFNEDDVHAPPQRVLRLYPRMIAGDLSAEPVREETYDQEEDDQEEDEKVNGEKAAKAEKTDTAVEVASPSRPGAFAKYWMGHRKLDSDAASIASSRRGGTDNEDAASINVKPKKEKGEGTEEEAPLEGKNLVKAVRELNSYLAGTRTRLQRWIDPATGKLKPRKPASSTDASSSIDENLDALLTNHHSDSDEQLERELRETFTVVDTALFRGLMFVTPTLAGSLFRIPNFCDPAVVNEHLLKHNRYNELALTLLRKFGDTDQEGDLALNGHADIVPEQLRGSRRTVGYLQKFADWVLRPDSENAETLPREKVVSYLGAIDLEDGTPDFHNQEGGRDEAWNEKLSSLVAFLRGSQQYSLSRALSTIPRDDPAFYEARAIVFSNMGSHKQALEIYVFNMQDYTKAEEYCNRIHALPSSRRESFAASVDQDEDHDPDSKPSIYHMLLSLYLTPPPPNKPNLGPALSLLSRHGSRLPAEPTLSLIPNDLPVAELESYFRGRIRAANSVISESRIVEGLHKTQLVNTQALLLLGDGILGGQAGRNRRVIIGEERVCGVCHKRLGNSVVAVLPDNSVVHYGCLGRQGRSTSNGQRSEQIAGSWGRHS